MMEQIEGSGDVDGRARIGIVVAKFNDVITKKLLEGALETLRGHDLPDEAITVAWVPGAFEIPLVAQELALSRRFDALIALGCVIKGQTRHFELVVAETAAGIARVSREQRLPIIFEVLAVDNIEIALDRAGRKLNRGSEAAEAALEMVSLMRQLRDKQ